MEAQEHVLISQLTTMRLGGPARYVVAVHSFEECLEAFAFASEKGLPRYVLGGGSNVIGRDEGFEGMVLLNKLSGIKVLSQGGSKAVVQVASGEELDAVVAFTAEQGWSGIEALSAIPGTVGGAVMQNAGAYGQEIADVVVSVEAYDTVTQETVVLEQSQLDFSYRHSIFNSSAKGRYFICSVTLGLSSVEIQGELFASLQAYLNDQNNASRHPGVIRNAVAAIRALKVPDPQKEASSGSFFKNVTLSMEQGILLRNRFPEIPFFQSGEKCKLASGWLIEQCGFKGRLLHGMRVSNASALILINESARSFKDLAAARAEIVTAVRERFGLTLEQEPEELPDHLPRALQP